MSQHRVWFVSKTKPILTKKKNQSVCLDCNSFVHHTDLPLVNMAPSAAKEVESAADTPETSPGKRKLRPHAPPRPPAVKRSRAEIHQQALERVERLAREKEEAMALREKNRIEKEKARRNSAKRIAAVEDAIQLSEKTNHQQSERPDLATQQAYRHILPRSVPSLSPQTTEADTLSTDAEILGHNDEPEDPQSDYAPPESMIASSESDRLHDNSYTQDELEEDLRRPAVDDDEDSGEDDDFAPPDDESAGDESEGESDESMSASEQTQKKKAAAKGKVSNDCPVRHWCWRH